MGKKKRYIDKSKSVSFHLVDKPHADPTGFESNNVRVWHQTGGPGSQISTVDEASQKRREEQKACGIYFDDDYDYLKHLRDRFGVEREQDLADVPLWENVEDGQFDDVVSVKSGKSRGGRSKKSDLFSEADFPSLAGDEDAFDSSFAVAVENQSDYNVMAAVSQEKPGPHWDKDIAATMDDEFKDFCDDLEDDFVALAGGIENDDYDEDFPELGAAGNYDGSDDDQNYEDVDDDNSLTGEGNRQNDWKDVLAETEDQHTDLPMFEEREKFLNSERQNYLESRSQKSRFTEYSLTSSVVPRSECQTDLDDHFETMYGEYDDLEVGALDHEGVAGHIPIDHPSILRVLGLDEDGAASKDKSQDVEDPEMRITIEDMTLRDQESASDVDSDDLFPEPPPKPEFDCESILSTYSNIYNRPKVITAEKKVQLDQSGMPKSEKDYPPPKLPNPEDDEMDRLKWIPPNVKRRDETKEETRARQKIQKEEQRLRRIEKKNNKLAFKMEEIRQQRADINKQRSSGFKY